MSLTQRLQKAISKQGGEGDGNGQGKESAKTSRPRVALRRSSIRRFTRIESGDYVEGSRTLPSDEVCGSRDWDSHCTFSGTLYDRKVLDRVLIQHTDNFSTETVLLEPEFTHLFGLLCWPTFQVVRGKLTCICIISGILLSLLLPIQSWQILAITCTFRCLGSLASALALFLVISTFIYLYSHRCFGAMERYHTIAWTINRFSDHLQKFTVITSPTFQTDSLFSGIEWCLTLQNGSVKGSKGTRIGLTATSIPYDLLQVELEVRFLLSDTVATFEWDPSMVRFSRQSLSFCTGGSLQGVHGPPLLIEHGSSSDNLFVQCHIGRVRYVPVSLRGLLCFLGVLRDRSWTKRLRECQVGDVTYPVKSILQCGDVPVLGDSDTAERLHRFKMDSNTILCSWTIPNFDLILKCPNFPNLISPRVALKNEDGEIYGYLRIYESTWVILMRIFLLDPAGKMLNAEHHVEVRDWNNNVVTAETRSPQSDIDDNGVIQTLLFSRQSILEVLAGKKEASFQIRLFIKICRTSRNEKRFKARCCLGLDGDLF